MEKQNPIREKSYSFALKSIQLYRILCEKKEFVMSKQFLKSSTSIGANVEEAMQGQSKKDFISKISIALKEAFETKYWLRLLRDSHFISEQEVLPFIQHIDEILRLLTAIIKSSKQ